MFFKALCIMASLSTAAGTAAAVTLRVQSLCSEDFTINTQINAATSDTVGSVTINGLEETEIPYVGSAEGIASIADSPSGDKAMEIISATHIRAYGWCFAINGVEPAAMPDKVYITSPDDVIHWYYGFAEMNDGQWITYCTPTHQAKPAYICSEVSAGE